MEDVTYKSFRYICKKYGADVMSTEFISSEALIRDVNKTMRKMTLFEFDRPIAIQIYGANIDSMVEAAKLAETFQPNYIDINFGCPMKKIAGKGAGSGLLRDIPKMIEMASQIVKAVNLPVTAKTRVGWDDNDKPIVEVSERLQDVGIQMLALHGRTRQQLYTGEADWEMIGKVKSNPRFKIPLIGNGDINGPEKAKKARDISGVDGLMIGRGAIGRPWIFREIKHYFQTGKMLPPPTVPEIVEVIKEQMEQSLSWKEYEKQAIWEMRRHFARYFPGVPDFRELRIALLRAEEHAHVLEILDQIVDKYKDTPVDYTNMSLK
ncbi:tRNA-dihydrouridine synthase [Prolixibacter bellariivorans]|uniref:tRNA-dihydrouridine synthase n=2 Tax=Prolixibacter bellariivorans TaxID=314319 RepID=A0A5M4AXT8_9BACT|nr:tRNA-dihydrouridine synthase [Prolixibacter bellariivorans]